MRCNLWKVLAIAGIVMLLPVSRAAGVDAEMKEKINRAIKSGVAFLKAEQEKEGTWSFPNKEAPQAGVAADTVVGGTALVGLTLLECDVPAADAQIQKAAAAIREQTVQATYTYSISLAIMFLDRLGDPGDVALIESLTVRLLAGQNRMGGWGYHCPSISPAEMKRLTTHIKEVNELVAKGGKLPKTAEGKRRTAKDLPREILDQLAVVAARRQGEAVAPGDNSNTQFATVALWIARRHGLPVAGALTRIGNAAQMTQNRSNGGWGYTRPSSPDEAKYLLMQMATASMTCSGLIQLAIGNGIFNETVLRSKNPKAKARDASTDPFIIKGFKALASCVAPTGEKQDHNKIRRGQGEEYYFLWSLERVAMAYNLEKIGNRDWYGWGSEILLANQGGDGSWRGKYGAGGVDTCFALLFLRRSNLTGDLTANLKGKRGGEMGVKIGGIGGAKLVGIEGGINPKDKKKRKEDKTPKNPDKLIAVEGNDQAAEIARLSTELVKAAPEKQEDLIKMLEKGKGVEFTEALVAAIPLLKGEIKEKARQAILQRMGRMKPATLADKLADPSPDVRRAAAVVVAKKKLKNLIPQLIGLLGDAEAPVVEAAYTSLKDLTGKDFGPMEGASLADKNEAVTKWKAWWKKQDKE